MLLCAFGALIREPLLSRFGAIRNVHPSLLPRWRGAAPVERAIMAGDAETGVSIMAVGEGLDDGPVYVAEREPIGPDDTYGTLSDRLALAERRAAHPHARRAARARPAAGRRHDVRGEDHRRRPHARPVAARGRARAGRARADAAHRRAGRVGRDAARHPPRPRGRGPRAGRAARLETPTARSSCSRSSRRAGGPWTPPRTCAATRERDGRSPARRAAFRVVLRVAEQGAFADQALHAEARGLDPRERALARRLAFAPSSAAGRSTTSSRAHRAAEAPRPAGPRGAPARARADPLPRRRSPTTRRSTSRSSWSRRSRGVRPRQRGAAARDARGAGDPRRDRRRGRPASRSRTGSPRSGATRTAPRRRAR